MIVGEHAVIRTAEIDDAHLLFHIYSAPRIRSFLLDRRHEAVVPTRDELRELLGRKDALAGVFFAVENKSGDVRGFCALRGLNQDARWAEALVALIGDEDYQAPLADEAMAFVLDTAFVQRKLNKVIAHSLDTEPAYRELLLRTSFQSNGVQREIVYSRGQWHDLEAFSLFHDASQTSQGDT